VSQQQGTRYAGVVTRGVALVLDAILMTAIEFTVAFAIGITVHVLLPYATLPTGWTAALVGVGWLVFVAAYLVGFWRLTERTPGMRVMGLSLQTVDGKKLGLRRCVRRLLGLVLSFMSFGVLFLPILFNERRRGFHDRLGRTVVVYDDRLEHEPPPTPLASPPVEPAAPTVPQPRLG
jgi:uncharacterized RDD family membrane protein YckC